MLLLFILKYKNLRLDRTFSAMNLNRLPVQIYTTKKYRIYCYVLIF